MAPSSPPGRESQRLESQGRGQPLHDHREGDDREGRDENVVTPRQVDRQGERQREGQRPAQPAPPHQMLLIERDRPARAQERQADRIDRDRATHDWHAAWIDDLVKADGSGE